MKLLKIYWNLLKSGYGRKLVKFGDSRLDFVNLI